MKRKWPAQKRISPSRSKPDFPLAILSSQVVRVHFARFNEVTHDFATRDATPRLEWWNNFESVSAIASLIGRRTTKTPSRPSRPSVEKWSAIDYHTRVGLVREIWISDRNEEEEWAYSELCNDRERETPSFAAGADEYLRGILGQSIRASAFSTRIKGNRHAELIRSEWEGSELGVSAPRRCCLLDSQSLETSNLKRLNPL